jgi:Fungal Zn(2)-Cys(6) binuclear cluster domain
MSLVIYGIIFFKCFLYVPKLTIHLTGDLLMRHRRRCKGPIKSSNRRKACDACFHAKVKCCYTQPTCTRCTKRGTPCIYATSSEQRSEPADTPPSSHNSTSSEMDFVASSQQFDLPAWDFSTPSYSMDAFDMTMAELSNPPLDTRTSFDATQPLIIDESMVFTNTSSSGMPVMTPIASSSNGSASSIASPPSSSAPYSLVRVLSDYPTLLMKGSFSTPILHMSMYALYSNIVPDMTYLPQTSMAICCGSGLNSPDTNRFFRRAMDAAQQRLIGSFVSAAR